jgi:hypothetical protein
MADKCYRFCVPSRSQSEYKEFPTPDQFSEGGSLQGVSETAGRSRFEDPLSPHLNFTDGLAS